MADAVLSRNNVEIKYNSKVEKIEGNLVVESVSIVDSIGDGGESQKLKVSAVFVAIGMEPDNSAFPELDKDEMGYIVADESCRTSEKGVFVAGDSRTKEVRQIITAASDGAIAAIAAANMINMY